MTVWIHNYIYINKKRTFFLDAGSFYDDELGSYKITAEETSTTGWFYGTAAVGRLLTEGYWNAKGGRPRRWNLVKVVMVLQVGPLLTTMMQTLLIPTE